MFWIRWLAVGMVSVVALACGDGDDSPSEGNPPEGILDDGGLSPALLALDDFDDGWDEPGIEPPNGSASHFVCMPLYFEGAFDEGVSIEFSGPTTDPIQQGPDVSQRIARYSGLGEIAMAAAPDALDFCLKGSSLATFGEPSKSSIEGLGDENLIAELNAEIEGTFDDGSGERIVSQDLTWRAAYIRRSELVTLLMFIDVEQDEFERLVRVADERLQELD